MNKNAILTAKKISDKYRKIRRKRKRAKTPKPIERNKMTKNIFSIEQIGQNCCKKISEKYKRLRYG